MNSNWSYSPETLNPGRNWRYFIPCDLEIWWMTLEINRAPLLYYIKLSASFQIHLWSLTRNSQFGSKSEFFVPCDLEIWRMTLKNNKALLLCCFKLCASFHGHWWIKAGVTVRKPSIRVKISNFLSLVTLQFDVWPWKNNRAPHLCYFKLCASFHSQWWIQTGVTVRKRPISVKFDDF